MSAALTDRLREGRERARGEFTTWHCRAGHELEAHPEAVEVWCGEAGHVGTNRMKRKDQYPSWAQTKASE